MSARVVNWSLYVVTFVLIGTGVATIGTNRADATWLYDAHRYTGALLCVLLIPKFGIIARAYVRRLKHGTWNEIHTWAGLLLTFLLLVSVLGALVWTLNLAPFWIQVILYLTPLALHWYVALALVPFFLWHIWVRGHTPPKLSHLPHEILKSKRTRRQALNLLGLGALGMVGLGALNLAANLTTWQRRFTGSRLVAEFTGNDFPVTQSDAPPAIDATKWRLRVRGNVSQELTLSYAELIALGAQTHTATLDCTLGWAATQNWRGVPLVELLRHVDADESAEVTVYAVTGAVVALSRAEIVETMIATHVGDETLSAAHGFPARLVVPSRRGYQWLKWINQIVVA